MPTYLQINITAAAGGATVDAGATPVAKDQAGVWYQLDGAYGLREHTDALAEEIYPALEGDAMDDKGHELAEEVTDAIWEQEHDVGVRSGSVELRGFVYSWALVDEDGEAVAEEQADKAARRANVETVATVLSSEWCDAIAAHVSQDGLGLDVRKWERYSACGEEVIRIAQLADYVASQWADAASDVRSAALHQMRVVCFG